jgi:integrase
LFGFRNAYSEYVAPGDAMAVRRAKAAAKLRHQALFDKVQRLPDDVKAKIAANGGDVLKLQDRIAELEDHVAHAIPLAKLMAPDTSTWLQSGTPMTSAQVDYLRVKMVQWQEENRAKLAALQPIALQAAPAQEYTLEALYALWVRVKAPKVERKHRATLTLFKAYLGSDVDYRQVTTADVQGWCDHLAQTGHTGIGATKHLDNLRGLFSASVPRHRQDNPAKGVKPEGKVVKGKRQSFTGAQLAMILDRAKATRFGGKRHVEVLWLLRLAIWTGARINELAQLRKDDAVTTESGVALIHIREGEGQSVKTGDARKVPLHSSIAAEFLAYAKSSKRDFIFGAFSDDKNNGRAAWIISNFRAFLDNKCGLTDRKMTLHSIRHRFHDAMDNAGIAIERQHVIVGHKAGDVHSKYGQVAGLRQLAADIEKLEPFAD